MKGIRPYALVLFSLVASGLLPTYATENFSGDIRFFIDGAGRAVLLVDSDAVTPPDGYVDEVFLLAQETAIDQSFSINASGAQVSYTENRVLVDAAGGSVHIDLAIGDPPPAGTGQTTYRILDGVELVWTREDGTALMNSYGTGGIDSGLLDDWVDPGPSCSSGGEGSTSCNHSGNGWSCGVSCGAGYYSCCNPPSDGGCKCYLNPGSGQGDLDPKKK